MKRKTKRFIVDLSSFTVDAINFNDAYLKAFHGIRNAEILIEICGVAEEDEPDA